MKVCLIAAALFAVVLAEAPAPPPGWQPSGRLLLVPARQEAYPPPAEYGPPETNTTQAPKDSQSDEKQSEQLLDSGAYYVLLPDGRLQMVKYTTAALQDESTKQVSSQNQQQQSSQQNFNYQQQNAAQSNQNAQYQGPFPGASSGFQQFQQQQQQQKAYASQNSQYRSPFPAGSSNFQPQPQPAQPQPAQPEPFARFQIQYVQFPVTASQYTQPQADGKAQVSAQTKNEEEEEDTEDESGFEANVQYRDVKPISAPIYAYNPTPLIRILKK